MLSIIIPTKNEPYINELIADIHKKVSAEHEILVVDKSDVPPQIKGARLILQKSDGLGNAVVEGLKEANGDIILMMDGDGSHEPSYINEMLKGIAENDIVIGSKYVPGGFTEDYQSRVYVSKILNLVIGSFLGLKVRDLMSGFVMYRRSVFDGLVLKPKGYKLALEILYKSSKKGPLKVKEIPVRFYKRKAGTSKVGFNRAGMSEVWRIFALTFSLRFGSG
jgi:dolichol-phosphate mannosyltransferase